MKRLFRKVSSIFLMLCVCFTAVPFTAPDRALGAEITAAPGPGTYDRYQYIKLYSTEGSITYSVYGRATVPETPYTVPVPIDEDVILSVDATVGGVPTRKEFSYKINPYILSTYPAEGTTQAPLNPKINIYFGRKMKKDLLETESNITITKISPAPVTDLSSTDYTATYSESTGSYKLEVELGGGVNLAQGATYMVSLKNITDSDGKALMGNKSFTFTTVTAAETGTYGWVRTDKQSYGWGQSVIVDGAYYQGNNQVSGAVDLQVQLFDHKGVRRAALAVAGVTNSRFTSTYSPLDNIPGTWTVKLYDGSNPRQLLAITTFTVVESTVTAPKADPVTGTYYEPIAVNLSTTTPGADIYYTVDYVESTLPGTVPATIPDGSVDSSCTRYSGPISVSAQGKTRIRAVAIKGGVKSGLLDETYTIKAELGWLKRSPNDGDGNIPLNTAVSVTFGRRVKSNTVNIQTFRLRESATGTEVAGNVSYNAEKRTATFMPVSPLKPNTQYQVILAGYTGGLDTVYIEDLNGVRLTSDVEWFFTTGADWIMVAGRPVVNNYVSVNKNPATVVVTSLDTTLVTINKVQAAPTGTNQFKGDVPLKPGNNTITIEITYSSSEKSTISITVNYLNLLQVDAEVTAAIPAKGKLELFDKQLTMDFPKGMYMKDSGGLPVSDQSLVFKISHSPMLDGFPSVSKIFDIQPKTAGAQMNNAGEGSITLTFDKYVSATSTPSLTVLCDPDGDGVWEENLGGRVDSKKRTITVPLGSFGRYVVVNKVWSFSDYTQAGWARPYVEYLWAKGYMSPLPTAGPGQFGLVDAQGMEIPITRGEFAVMIGKVLRLNKSNYTNYGIFSDMRLLENANPPYAMVKDLDGYWKNIDDDDYKYIDMLARNGVINGSVDEFGNLVFNYYRYISREEVAVILARAMNMTVEANDSKVSAAIKKMYTDADTSIGVWAQPYVLAVSKGYFGGFPDKTFKGKDNFTRPQASRVLYQAMQKAKLM
ncbi:MAG: Ig-like domain-containing protein [Bacillota bacterium]